jgi:hypothetical protein
MKHRSRSESIDRHKLAARYGVVRGELLAHPQPGTLAHPLAYWALPTDRRLPLAFLGYTVRDLLAASFEDLCSKPGVGMKKLRALMDLLARVAADPEPVDGRSAASAESPAAGRAAGRSPAPSQFDPSAVSESQWARWRAAVRRRGLEQEALGRFAVSLVDLPRVIWHTPLGAYTGRTLAEIRALKTHGEKRVNAVISVFAMVYQAVGEEAPPEHLEVRIASRLAARLEDWLQSVLVRTSLPSLAELRRGLAEPMVEQVRIDVSPTVAGLVQGRLGLRGGEATVRQTAARMGLTRARVYQLLDEAAETLRVRWPESAERLVPLRDRFAAAADRPSERDLVLAAIELFSTTRRSSSVSARKPARGSGAGLARQAG